MRERRSAAEHARGPGGTEQTTSAGKPRPKPAGRDLAGIKRGETTVEQRPKCYSNALTVRASQQVLLEVRFIEAQRTAARDLGFNWNINGGRFAAGTGIGATPLGMASLPVTAAFAAGGFPSGNTTFATMITRILDGGTSADVIIQALEKRGLARRLAEPNLTTLSGDTANFLAGGEFPFPFRPTTTASRWSSRSSASALPSRRPSSPTVRSI